MSRAVERLGGIVIPLGAYRPQQSAISAFTDIGQGAGTAASTGFRPLLPPIIVGALAHLDAGIDLNGTDWHWMESWIFVGALAVLFIAGWLIDRSRTNLIRRGGSDPESRPDYAVLGAACGALVFGASLAAGGETSWPGLVAGAAVAFVGYLAFSRLFMRANRRLAAAGDSGTLLGLGRDLLTIAVVVLVVLVDVLGYVVLLAALALAIGARRREGEKYEGLRVLR